LDDGDFRLESSRELQAWQPAMTMTRRGHADEGTWQAANKLTVRASRRFNLVLQPAEEDECWAWRTAA